MVCFLNNWHDTLSEAVGGKQILGVQLHNFANISYGIQFFLWNIGFFTAWLFETEFSLALPMVADLSMGPVGYGLIFFYLWVIKLAWTVWRFFQGLLIHTWTETLTLICKRFHNNWHGIFFLKYIDRHKPYQQNSNTNPNL